MPKGARAARVRVVLILKTLNNCTLSILVSNPMFGRQRTYFHIPVSY